MDNNRMTYAHHIIGETHVNLLIIGSDFEALQESTLKPTIFETIVVRIENQSLLMAVPCVPEHVRFKNNLTLMNEETNATVFKAGTEKYFAIVFRHVGVPTRLKCLEMMNFSTINPLCKLYLYCKFPMGPLSFREFTRISRFVLRIYDKYFILFAISLSFSQNHFKFTICFVNSLYVLHYVIREFTILSLSRRFSQFFHGCGLPKSQSLTLVDS